MTDWKTKTLGKTGWKVGRLGLASSYGADDCCVQMAFERGVNYLYRAQCLLPNSPPDCVAYDHVEMSSASLSSLISVWRNVALLIEAIEAAENHLSSQGFESDRLEAATGFDRIEALRDAVDALYTSDEAKRRFEIMARQVFVRFEALLMEPSAFAYAVRHDNIEDQRDTVDVTEEGLCDDELDLFDLLFRNNISKTDRERLKQASRSLLASLKEVVGPIQDWTEKAPTQAEVKTFILHRLYLTLSRPPFTDAEIQKASDNVYSFEWQKSASQPSAGA